MKTFTKILAMVLALATTAALSVGLTTAYLQDQDQDVNVMTLGNVQIEQIEQEWNDDKTQLVDFTQCKPLYPNVGELGWENSTADGGAYRRFTMNNVVDKYVSVKNTGKSDAYVRTIIALEMGDVSYADLGNIISASVNKYDGSEFQFAGAWDWTHDFEAKIDGKNYNIMVAVHKAPVKPGETTIPSLLQVYMKKDATNEDCEKIDGNKNGTYDILVLSQAVQTAGFADAKTALNAGFGDITVDNHPWADTAPVIPTVVSTADELATALTAGGEIVLAEDIEADADNTITIPAGVTTTLDLNGNTIEFVTDDADKNADGKLNSADNEVAIDVRGTLTVKNGTITTKHTGGTNFGWNACTEVFYVAFNGTLNVENATIENLGGSDMAYAIDLVNATDVTLNIQNSTIKSTYIPVRVFNNGSGMNNVTIEGSTLYGVSRAFWVHIYSNKDNGGKGVKDATLNLDIYGNGNTFVASNPNRIIEFGFDDVINFDANGKQI